MWFGITLTWLSTSNDNDERKEKSSEILGKNHLHRVTIHVESKFLAPHSPHRPTSRELTYPISIPWHPAAVQVQVFSWYCSRCRTLSQESQHMGIGGEWWVVQTLHVTLEEEGDDRRGRGFVESGWERFGWRLFESSSSDPVSSTSYGLPGLVPHINPLISSFIRLFASSSSSSGLMLPLGATFEEHAWQLHPPHFQYRYHFPPLSSLSFVESQISVTQLQLSTL